MLHAESLAAVRAEEADELAAKLAEARQLLADTGAPQSGTPRSPTVDADPNASQGKQWLPHATSDAAARAWHSSARLSGSQVTFMCCRKFGTRKTHRRSFECSLCCAALMFTV